MNDGYSWRRTWEAPMKRLHQDAIRSYMDGQRRCWEFCGSPLAREHIVRFVDGWVFVRGPEMDAAAEARMGALAEHIRTIEAGGSNFYDAEVKPKAVALGERLRQHPAPTRPLDELVSHLEEGIEAHAELMGYLHWQLAVMSIARMEGPGYEWPQKYAEITGRPEVEASSLIGATSNEMSKLVRELRELALIMRSDGEGSERFADGLRSLLGRHGHRTGTGWGSSANHFDVETWNVNPDIPLQMIASYARSDLDAIEEKERETAKERERLTAEVRGELASDPDRLARFEAELARATYHSYVLEDHNDWLDQQASGILRDAEYIVGLNLVTDGVIDDPCDVAHLALAELRDVPSNARELIAQRKEEIAAQTAGPPPERLGEEPAQKDPTFHDEGEGHVGNELRGVASSPGRYTGRARVFAPSPIPPDVDDGDILVAKDAGPDWTPLFAILGAVVLDVGAIWQHAAVVAREFGIPAVTGTKDGTTVITDGQTITVDGTTGIVELG